MNTKKLTAKQAKRIAWQYIYSWASEAARDDTAFFEVQVPGELHDINNEQHKTAISKEFKRAEKYIWKRYKNYISPDSI